MDKGLIGIAILLGSILVIENYALNTQALIFIDFGKWWTLALISLWLWAMLWFGLKWLMAGKKSSEYDDYDWF